MGSVDLGPPVKMYRLLAAILCLQLVAGNENLPELTIAQGKLKGTVGETINGRKFYAFEGVPYAKPPVGKHRFKPPSPIEPWIGVWNATSKPSYCIQLNYLTMNTPFAVMGSEDCLYINIYTPKLPSSNNDQPLDVLANIHGGGFQFLTGSAYGPEYILDHDIILVTFNYRLGTLGFLTLEDDVLPGNNGLKDQLLALKWIKENIAAFGGDPNKVTISGMSAGGGSVHYHLLSKQSRGLFHKAILSSGVVANPWAIAENVKAKSLKLAQELGCPISSSKKILDCLREKPAEHIALLNEIFRYDSYLPIGPIGPTIEKSSDSAFIDKMPFDIIKDGEAADVPLLFAFNNDEGLFPGASLLTDESGKYDKNWDTAIPKILDFEELVDANRKVKIAQKLKEHYLKGKTIRDEPAGFMELLGDRFFYNGIIETAKMHAEYYKSPVYSYRFSYVGEHRLSDSYNIGHLYEGGACHGDEAHYVLRASYVPVEGTPKAAAMIKYLTGLWVNFIKGTVPSTWKTVKTGLPDLAMLDIVCSDPANNLMKVEPETPGHKLWKSFNLPENSIELIETSHAHNEL